MPDQIYSQTIGKSPYVADDTRAWADSYRFNNKLKPAFVLRTATDSNYVNNQVIGLPAYGGKKVFCQAISNINPPGMRLVGCLNWQVTESLDNITQTASLTCLDAFAQSRITTTATNYLVGSGTPQGLNRGYNTSGNIVNGPTGTVTAASRYGSNIMPQQWFSNKIRYSWVMNGIGVTQQLVGDLPISAFTDPTLANNDPGFTRQYQEGNLNFRQFEPEIIQVASLSTFPDPAVPAGEAEGFNEWWNVDTTGSLSGVGGYFILVDQEIMLVTRIDRANNFIFVIPGGRGVAGQITSHSVGATVTLLGFPPYTGQWAGFGYLMPQDYKVNQSIMRPGTCWVSYEGYGNPGQYVGTGPQGLSKTFNRANNMNFTGYWFAQSPQITLDNTGVPQLTITFQSAGYLLSEQKIDPNNIQRSSNMFYSWSKATFDAIGYTRSVPGDWYDFNSWDPTLPGAYPLTISTEFAQNQAFFNHMQDTNNGETCEFCQAEWLQYVLNHENGQPTGSIAESRVVGKHIYFESIRVFNLGGQFNAGPIKTFGRLMHALAMAAWDNPQPGNALGTRWTKLPNQLFDNMVNFINGRVWNGQAAYAIDGGSRGYDWSNEPSSDLGVYGLRKPLKSPFTSQYDRQPWSQPMQDLADLNRMTYSISREGYPIFSPLNKKLRGLPSPWLHYYPGYTGPITQFGNFINAQGAETADLDIGLGEWHLAYGGSIDSYTHTIDPTSVLTIVYVSCQTAFGDEITFTIPAAGTGIQINTSQDVNTSETIVQYSNVVGNKEGLQLTSGAQQTDAVSLDNILLGLDWNTQPATWGMTVSRSGDGFLQIDAQPPMPNPDGLKLYFESNEAKTHPRIVKNIQKCLNFFIERRYIGAPTYDQYGTVFYVTGFMNEDGSFTGKSGLALQNAIHQLQDFLNGQPNINMSKVSGKYVFTRAGINGIKVAGDDPGVWGQSTYQATQAWINSSSNFIKTDVWWYVQNGLPWDQYVSSIVGLNIPQIPSNSSGTDGSGTQWQIDQTALATEAQDWMKQFFQDAINYGNSIVDDSINKATQKVINTNLADPRIQLGDVIWADVPGYLSANNVFGNSVVPFLNGVYITGITRSLDLQQGTYTGSYSGYRYRGNFESNITTNPNNYCSISTKV